jgi:cytochrome P450
MPYNNSWRTIRKIMHQLLTAKQAEIYRPFQDKESKQLLWDYLHDPKDFFHHNGRYANSVIMSVVFGKRTRSDDPNVVQLFQTIDDFLGSAGPPGWMVDLFPQLALLPKFLQWWRPFGEDGYNRTIEYLPLTVLTSVYIANSSPSTKSQ